MKHLMLALALLALAVPAFAQTTTMPANYTWTAPTTGSVVVSYVIQHSVDGGTWTQIATSPTASYTLAAAVGFSHRLRVAGVDAQARQGIFSDPSEPYTPDPGAPGVPGKPIRIP